MTFFQAKSALQSPKLAYFHLSSKPTVMSVLAILLVVGFRDFLHITLYQTRELLNLVGLGRPSRGAYASIVVSGSYA